MFKANKTSKTFFKKQILTCEDLNMTVINTNIAATITANAMRENARTMETSMERLATGKRINSASDDAAGLAIGSRMEAQIRGLEQAARNSNDAISYLQTFDGAAIEIGDMLQRMRELSVQATNGSNGANDIANLDKEFAALATEIDRIAEDTKFNGIDAMAAGKVKSFTIGADADDTVSVSVKSFALADGASVAGPSGVMGTDTIAGTAANIAAALNSAGGVLQISDGDTMISITKEDVQTANNDATITFTGSGANEMDMTEFLKAINVAADASSAFTGTFVASSPASESTFDVNEKAAYYGADDTYTLTGSNSFSSVASDSVDGTVGTAGGIYGVDFSDYKDTASSAVTVSATTTIAELDTAITNLAAARADFGAVINRLEHTVDNLSVSAVNTKAAKSAIIDADYASETTELARTQIISQASTAMLSQANQQAQSVLALLK